VSTPGPGLDAALHYASVNYVATFGGLSVFGGKVAFGMPGGTQFSFAFETGRTQASPQLDLWDVSWDYSWFDQAAQETEIAIALGAICTALSSLLDLPLADVEQSVTVQRVWTFAPNVQGSAASLQLAGSTGAWTEVMSYPPQVSGSDSAVAAEDGQVAS
jgi:hypothetical protein